VAKDYAKKRSASPRRAPARKKESARPAPPRTAGNGVRWYAAGVLTGVFLSFLLYLGTLPPTSTVQQQQSGDEGSAADNTPKPRFDFYTMLPQQTIEEDLEPAQPAGSTRPASKPDQYYLLQAGSFRQREDADRRRAELLLLGLEPRVEESTGDNGRWFRVFLGPFESRSKMSKVRSLTAAQNIDTLVLKRSG
jgi:cell division protein FtsN